MSRKKLLLSIFLTAALVSAGVVLPSIKRAEHPEAQEHPKKQMTQKPKLPSENTALTRVSSLADLQYLGFESLEYFFSSVQIEDLKEQLAAYLQETGKTENFSVTFLADETSYPTSGETILSFALSDGSTLPVTCQTATGNFTFGEEHWQMDPEHSLIPRIYARQTDDSLPAVTTEEIEFLQEGGYADTKSNVDKHTGSSMEKDAANHNEALDESENEIEIDTEEAQP